MDRNEDIDAGRGDGIRRIDLAFVRSGDVVELLVLDLPPDVKVRHAYWDYDAERISGLYSGPGVTGDEEQRTFIGKAMQAVQDWDSGGGMRNLRDARRIADLERRLAESGLPTD